MVIILTVGLWRFFCCLHNRLCCHMIIYPMHIYDSLCLCIYTAHQTHTHVAVVHSIANDKKEWNEESLTLLDSLFQVQCCCCPIVLLQITIYLIGRKWNIYVFLFAFTFMVQCTSQRLLSSWKTGLLLPWWCKSQTF